ncbi:DUF2271 domain-containing protein [Ideonella sp. YS5]|uniref:DUF2271 domain-containing protein n=1 Tax=Ideonella sp. YS5 TaxID=3453714 RepID=UPI003EEABC04
MKHAWPLATIAGALAVPAAVSARQVTLETQLTAYGGDGAYLAIYLMDPGGRLHSTLWVAGRKAKYWRHLRDWYRSTGGNAKVDGITGASVGAGKTLRVTVDVADALIDAGYEVHIDTAVEKMKENPSEVVVPLSAAGAGKPAAGRGYVMSFRYTL